MAKRFTMVAVLLAASVAGAEIRVANIADGETIRHPVALLRGTAGAGGRVKVANADNARPGGTNEAAVVEGRFVVLVELVEGKNRLTLSAGGETAELALTYAPLTAAYALNVVYVTPEDGDARYGSPFPDDDFDYAARLDTAAKLMQTLTAESLHVQGYGRRTFRLDLDGNGKVRVHTVAYPKSGDELRTMTGDALYGMLYGWVAGQFPVERGKNMVIMSFTRWDAKARRGLAHTALGGGGMGLFGSGTLYAWPRSLREVDKAFSDATEVDPATTFDDSAGRGTIWGNAATCLGAVLHEMGHTFHLPHTNDPFCIMSRGFDRFNRVFTVVEPPARGGRDPVRFGSDEIAYWSPYFAAQLAQNRWFQADAKAFTDSPGPRASWDAEGKAFVLDDGDGIAFWGFNRGEDFSKTLFATPKEGTPLPIRIPRADVLARLGEGGPITILMMDRQGNSASSTDARLIYDGDYLRQWRVSPKPVAWTNRPASPEAADVAAIVAALRSEPVRDFKPSPDSDLLSMDFHGIYKGGENACAYALALVHADAATPRRLLVGSDDGIRVWVNGRLAIDQPGLRHDPPDAHSADVTLAPGENTILVEVTQGGGGWGFSLRSADR